MIVISSGVRAGAVWHHQPSLENTEGEGGSVGGGGVGGGWGGDWGGAYLEAGRQWRIVDSGGLGWWWWWWVGGGGGCVCVGGGGVDWRWKRSGGRNGRCDEVTASCLNAI